MHCTKWHLTNPHKHLQIPNHYTMTWQMCLVQSLEYKGSQTIQLQINYDGGGLMIMWMKMKRQKQSTQTGLTAG